MYVSTPEIIKAFIYRTTTIIASRYTGWPKKNAPTLSVEISVITNKSLFLFVLLDRTLFFCFCFGLSRYLEHRNVILTQMSPFSPIALKSKCKSNTKKSVLGPNEAFHCATKLLLCHYYTFRGSHSAFQGSQ